MCWPLCHKSWNFYWVRNLWILWSFTQHVNVNNIYTNNSGENVGYVNMHFNHKLFDIYIYIYIYNLSRNNKKVIQTCRLFDILFYRASALQQNQAQRNLSFNSILSSLSAKNSLSEFSFFLVIYKLLLLFIGKLKIASPWISSLDIKGCNNYLPKT